MDSVNTSDYKKCIKSDLLLNLNFIVTNVWIIFDNSIYFELTFLLIDVLYSRFLYYILNRFLLTPIQV